MLSSSLTTPAPLRHCTRPHGCHASRHEDAWQLILAFSSAQKRLSLPQISGLLGEANAYLRFQSMESKKTPKTPFWVPLIEVLFGWETINVFPAAAVQRCDPSSAARHSPSSIPHSYLPGSSGGGTQRSFHRAFSPTCLVQSGQSPHLLPMFCVPTQAGVGALPTGGSR